MLITEILNC